MTPEEAKLHSEIERMNRLMIVFASIAFIMGLFVLLRFIGFSETPDGGSVGMVWIFGWFLWVPFTFFPTIGVYMAWDRKQKLTARLSELNKKNDDNAA